MKSPRFSKEQLNFIKQGFIAMRIPELTAAFNAEFDMDLTEKQIQWVIKNRRFVCGRRGKPKGQYLSMTAEQAEFIKQGYKTMSRSELTLAFNERFPENRKRKTQIIGFIKNHGIKTDRTGFFQPGSVPWTKGKKGTGLCKANAGSFKKGNKPINVKPIGHERADKDGYIRVKVAEKDPHTGAKCRYRQKHRVIWEAVNGPIPKGQILTFIDGDRTNCAIENLELMNRHLHVTLNRAKYWSAPPEIKPTIRALAELLVLITEKKAA